MVIKTTVLQMVLGSQIFMLKTKWIKALALHYIQNLITYVCVCIIYIQKLKIIEESRKLHDVGWFRVIKSDSRSMISGKD